MDPGTHTTLPQQKTALLGQLVVVHTFNPSTQDAEAGGSLWVWGQPALQELTPGQAPKLQRNPVLKNQPTNQTNKTKQNRIADGEQR